MGLMVQDSKDSIQKRMLKSKNCNSGIFSIYFQLPHRRFFYIRYNMIIVPWCYRFVQKNSGETNNTTINSSSTSSNIDEKATIPLFQYTKERKLDVSLMLY